MDDIGPHLALPESAREDMREPLGPVIAESDLVLHVRRTDTLIAVGDMVTLTLADAGYRLALAVFDYKTLRDDRRDFRQRLGELQGERARARNPPATITKELWAELETAMFKVNTGGQVLLEVEGEEDLAAIPAILLAPDGAKVLYGMPGRGIVVVTANKAGRAGARRLLRMLSPRNGWKDGRARHPTIK
ncbi:MAG: DUF359 domain-containing protein [Euryarchaeota archaeon]|nr:DUF359 domain-containing protein [Euryarchaeota archaeon]